MEQLAVELAIGPLVALAPGPRNGTCGPLDHVIDRLRLDLAAELAPAAQERRRGRLAADLGQEHGGQRASLRVIKEPHQIRHRAGASIENRPRVLVLAQPRPKAPVRLVAGIQLRQPFRRRQCRVDVPRAALAQRVDVVRDVCAATDQEQRRHGPDDARAHDALVPPVAAPAYSRADHRSSIGPGPAGPVRNTHFVSRGSPSSW